MVQSTRFALLLVVPVFAIASQGAAYTYHWEMEETPQGAESASLIEPVQVVLLDEVVEVASHSASLQLREKYSVHLGTEWNANHAYSLLRTFESIPQAMNNPYDWDDRDREGRPLASGVYLYRLVTAESVLTRKLILLR